MKKNCDSKKKKKPRTLDAPEMNDEDMRTDFSQYDYEVRSVLYLKPL